ncbi:MAG: trans-2,3-dihydro-3-hydroxyanthranilate isomerase [Polaribacter sp.]|jgi:trans-2,3-dihydro-3-hydroxyanthranilate isomerase
MSHNQKIPFYILDVFAKQKFQGNQLAVLIDLEDQLSPDQMLKITREINFAESAFIKKKNGPNEYQIRIFTPEYEVPFAGHPSIGSSYIIAKYLIDERVNEVILNEKGGDIKVSISSAIDLEDSLFMMQQVQPTFRATFTKSEIFKGLGIAEDSIKDSQVIQEITTGLPYLIIPLKDLKSMEALKPSPPLFESFLIKNKLHKSNSADELSTSLFFYTSETHEDGNDFNTRMFVLENDKIVEDAATGSANGCFLAYLLKHKNKTIKANVEQGFQMGRPSYLFLDGKESDGVYEIGVGGYSKEVAKGEWILD